MPRYFFHVHDGSDIPDKEGTVLAGVEEARKEAVALAGALLREHGLAFWNSEEAWRMVVEEEAGERVCELHFTARTAT